MLLPKEASLIWPTRRNLLRGLRCADRLLE